jgi:hypothetical protein
MVFQTSPIGPILRCLQGSVDHWASGTVMALALEHDQSTWGSSRWKGFCRLDPCVPTLSPKLYSMLADPVNFGRCAGRKSEGLKGPLRASASTLSIPRR